MGLGQPRAVTGWRNPHRCTTSLVLECERHYGYSTSCKTQRQLIKSSNLKGHPVVQHVPIQRGVKELHRLLLVLHLLERGYTTAYPSGGREGSTCWFDMRHLIFGRKCHQLAKAERPEPYVFSTVWRRCTPTVHRGKPRIFNAACSTAPKQTSVQRITAPHLTVGFSKKKIRY